MSYIEESFAHVLWCPFARTALTTENNETVSGAPVFNRIQWYPTSEEEKTPHDGVDERVYTVPGTECIGSACMAWRWRNHKNERGAGYCGLVGRPE